MPKLHPWRTTKAPLELEGDKETILMFNKLTEETKRKVLIKATRQGAAVVRDEARKRAPIGRYTTSRSGGNLRRNIVEVIMTSGEFLASVGISWRNKRGTRGSAFYGLFVERGTKPRYQQLNKKFSDIGRRRIIGSTPKSVGEMVSRPFLEPAFDAKKGEAAKVIISSLKKIIIKTAKKYGAK